MPARREIFAGRKELMWRPWGGLEPDDARLPRLVEAAGHRTVIVTDHYHYWEESANGYLQSFQQTELVRGHEWDAWNFESFDPGAHAHYEDAQYLPAPIGDPITTEDSAPEPDICIATT